VALAWYSIAIHRGITRFAHSAGWILDGGFVREGSLPARWRGDGVIVVSGIHADVDAFVARLRVPTVNIGYHAPKLPSVAADSAAVGRLAAEHFLSRGFRHFAFYESSRTPGEISRRDGFVEVLRKAGHQVHLLGPPAAAGRAGPRSRDDRWTLLGRQLARLPKPIAVMAEYDDRAIDVIDAALLAGLRVPEQVAVLGVDNDELRCPFASVPLSSIDNDEGRVGFEAARLLQRLMNGQRPPSGPVLIPPRGIVVRQSTNILAIPHEHVATALRLIWEHYTDPIDVARVAQQIPISYAQLHASFVKHVGHTMADEIETRRLEHARRLLTETDAKVSEVARRSGFGSADRMGRVFVRRLNTTPSDYRAAATAGEDARPSSAGEAAVGTAARRGATASRAAGRVSTAGSRSRPLVGRVGVEPAAMQDLGRDEPPEPRG
jgi:LacI family transcriptional regulator